MWALSWIVPEVCSKTKEVSAVLQSRLVEQKEKLMYLQREHEKLANEHEKIEKQI